MGVGRGRKGKARHLPPPVDFWEKIIISRRRKRVKYLYEKLKLSVKYSVIYVPVYKPTILERSVKLF
jgi:hypothetical protein